MQRLFVYGSLGPGRPNEHLMQKIGGQWQAASLRGRLLEKGWGAGMGFPGLAIDADGEEILAMCSSPTASPSTGPRWMNSKAPNTGAWRPG